MEEWLRLIEVPNVDKLASPFFTFFVENSIAGLEIVIENFVDLFEHGSHTLGGMLVELLHKHNIN